MKKLLMSEIKPLNKNMGKYSKEKGIPLRTKPFIDVNTLFDKIVSPVLLKTERLTVCDVEERDAKDYYDLCADEENNKFWGYDYKKDLKKPLTKDYFYQTQLDLKARKEEYSLAIKYKDRLVGEIVLWNMTDEQAEIGYRIKKEYQGRGYDKESVKRVIDYLFSELSAKTVCARVIKLNGKSAKLLIDIGFNKIKEDETYYYYEKQN